MFEKKSYIFSEALGVCLVKDIASLDMGNGEKKPYYVLHPLSGKAKVSYIPVEGHQMKLRELISVEEAKERVEADPKASENEEIAFVIKNSNNA